MKKDLRADAERLAKRPYRILITRDETTDGKATFAALVVELDGCIGHGNTEEQAATDAANAAIDYIESLLADGLPVPLPLKMMAVSHSSGSSVQVKNHQAEKHPIAPETAKPDYIMTPV